MGEIALPEIRSVKENASIKVLRDVNPTIRPPVAVSLGCHYSGASFLHPDPHDTDTMVAGVAKRISAVTPLYDPSTLIRFQKFVRNWCHVHLVPLKPDDDISFETWIENTNYTLRRKEELRRKFSEFNGVFFDCDDVPNKFTYNKCFQKDEFYPEPKHARGIFSRHDAFKCVMGPIFKLIESQLYQLHWFIKHVPVCDRARVIIERLTRVREGQLKFLATDYTSYESHFIREIMESCEFVLYDYMSQHLPIYERFMRLCRRVLGGRNFCQFKNFKLELDATRMSGEMCTSLGNSFTNLMVILFLCEECGSSVDGFVEGDDGIFVVVGRHPTSDDYRRLGFTVKLEVHDSVSTASFCGIIMDEDEMVNLVNPIKEILKFGWGNSKYCKASPRKLKELLHAKSLSLAYQYPGCPVVASLARYGLRVTKGSRLFIGTHVDGWQRSLLLESFNYYKSHGIPNIAVGPKSRLLVEKKFGVTVADQLAIEQYFDSLQTIEPLQHHAIETYISPAQYDYFRNYSRESELKENLYYPDFPIVRGKIGTAFMSRATRTAPRSRRATRRARGGLTPRVPVTSYQREMAAQALRQAQYRAAQQPKKKKKPKKPKSAKRYLTKGLITMIKGFGDYSINNNSIMNGQDPPVVQNSANGIIVRHREYLRDINATTAFTLTSMNINPGLIGSFPWLSAVAENFEQYKWRGLLYEFKSLSSDSVLSSSTSSALGSVIMATQYDALDPAFPNKFNMENYEYANSSKPSHSFIHPVECKRNQTAFNELFIRNGAAPTGSDLRLYDIGVFNIATVGMQAASGVAGELWCTYEVELIKPKLVGDVGTELLVDHFNLKSIVNASPLGTTTTAAAGCTLGGATTGTTYTFPNNILDGTFLVVWTVVGASTAITNPVLSSTTGSFLTQWFNNGSANAQTPTGTTTTTTHMVVLFRVSTTPAVITFGAAGTLPAGATGGDLYVIQTNASLSLLGKAEEILQDGLCDSEEHDPDDVDCRCDECHEHAFELLHSLRNKSQKRRSTKT